jgi:hypothetical protein
MASERTKRVTPLRPAQPQPAPESPQTRQRRRELENIVLDATRMLERVTGRRVRSIGLRRTAAGDVAAVDVDLVG